MISVTLLFTYYSPTYIYSHYRHVTTNILHELLISLIRISDIANYN